MFEASDVPCFWFYLLTLYHLHGKIGDTADDIATGYWLDD
jgi:hypothetical protein